MLQQFQKKATHPIIFPPVIGKLSGRQTGLFCLGIATGLGEKKIHYSNQLNSIKKIDFVLRPARGEVVG